MVYNLFKYTQGMRTMTFNSNNTFELFNGDCIERLKTIESESVDLIVTSPPYCMKKAYENPKDDINAFKKHHEDIFDDIYRILKVGGSICWQTGYHVNDSSIIPLDYIIYDMFTSKSNQMAHPLILRNRIIWTFGHGLNSTMRFSGRHETILWFTKGEKYSFYLDEVRVPQKYPGKRFYKGDNKGKLSGNPLGKNPSDVWEIPNVKANHIEKTIHPCQFPVAIPQRLIKALVPEGGIVLDPYMGVGTTGVAAVLEKKYFIGCEIQEEYFEIAKKRINDAKNGVLRYREDKPAMTPDENMSVAKLPEEFALARRKKYEEG